MLSGNRVLLCSEFDSSGIAKSPFMSGLMTASISLSQMPTFRDRLKRLALNCCGLASVFAIPFR